MRANVKTIEWEHMDKRKFYLFGPTLFLGIRAFLHPANLIKIRLQAQKKQSLYNGTFDAFKKIFRYEGVRGLYKGFLVSCYGLLSGQFYITTYELVRQKTAGHSIITRGLIAGGCASLVGQTITVPVDIISQKLMVQGQGSRTKKLKGASFIITDIFHRHGLKGFYRGYFVSLMTYAPSSAIWWSSYGFYSGLLLDNLPSNFWLLLIQGTAGSMAGVTAAILTNPIDIVRTRMQLQIENRKSVAATFQELIKVEGIKGMTKGMSARILSMVPSSIVVILGYETVKRLSLRTELIEEGIF